MKRILKPTRMRRQESDINTFWNAVKTSTARPVSVMYLCALYPACTTFSCFQQLHCCSPLLRSPLRDTDKLSHITTFFTPASFLWLPKRSSLTFVYSAPVLMMCLQPGEHLNQPRHPAAVTSPLASPGFWLASTFLWRWMARMTLTSLFLCFTLRLKDAVGI